MASSSSSVGDTTGGYDVIDLTNSEEGEWEQAHTGDIYERYSPDLSNAYLFEDLEDKSLVDDIFGENSSDNADAMEV